jgi:putative flippase GtrA
MKFIVVGCVNTLVDAAVFNAFLFLMPHPLPASAVPAAKAAGFLCANIFSYVFNSLWTFKEGKLGMKRYGSFVLVSVVGLCINVAAASMLFAALSSAGYAQLLSANAAFFGATLVSFGCTYIGYKKIVFRV